MACYDGVCRACGWEGEVEKSIHADFPLPCPSCRRKKVEQDYSKPKFVICRTDDVKTVGQRAEKNLREMGPELAQRKKEEILGPRTMAKRNAPTPWWREPGSKPLDVTQVKDVKRFIETGEKG